MADSRVVAEMTMCYIISMSRWALFAHVRWGDWAWDCLGISQQDLPDSEIKEQEHHWGRVTLSQGEEENTESLPKKVKDKFLLSFHQGFLSPRIYTTSILLSYTHPHYHPHHRCTPPPTAQPKHHHQSPNSPGWTRAHSGKEGRRVWINRCRDLSRLSMDHNSPPSLCIPFDFTNAFESMKDHHQHFRIFCSQRI